MNNYWYIISIGDNTYYGGLRNNVIRIVYDKDQAKRYYNQTKAEAIQMSLRLSYRKQSIQLVLQHD